MDIQILEQQMQGLNSKLAELRQQQAIHHKAQGLQEQEEKLRKEIQSTENKIQGIKEELSELRAKKAEAVGVTADALADQMGSLLPEGKAFFEVKNGRVVLGLDRDGRKTPYEGLSGGEAVSFNAALAKVLLGDSRVKVIAIEAAELDDSHMLKMLTDIANEGLEDTQFLVNTCHMPEGEIPEGWEVIKP